MHINIKDKSTRETIYKFQSNGLYLGMIEV
jgi:hypothetical protein